MLRYFHKNAKGFTLIELLIVVAIIGILAAIAIPNLLNAQRRAKISRAAADSKTIVTQTQLFYNDKNAFPTTLGAGLTGLQGAGYVSSIIDPFAAAGVVYQYTLNGAAFSGVANANMTDDIRAWSVGPDGATPSADDVGYSNQGGAFGS
jgi:prepilin-type N-terminal cleavage/methylation domain-containing protein